MKQQKVYECPSIRCIFYEFDDIVRTSGIEYGVNWNEQWNSYFQE